MTLGETSKFKILQTFANLGNNRITNPASGLMDDYFDPSISEIWIFRVLSILNHFA